MKTLILALLLAITTAVQCQPTTQQYKKTTDSATAALKSLERANELLRQDNQKLWSVIADIQKGNLAFDPAKFSIFHNPDSVSMLDDPRITALEKGLKFWNDSIPKLDNRLSAALRGYMRSTEKLTGDLNTKVDNMGIPAILQRLTDEEVSMSAVVPKILALELWRAAISN